MGVLYRRLGKREERAESREKRIVKSIFPFLNFGFVGACTANLGRGQGRGVVPQAL
jgi:hypothetical protein